MSHPLDHFAFCPHCGSKDWHINDFKSKRCLDCGFVYYLNPATATAAFILNERGELLVVRRAQEPAKGTLDLPGGFADPGETTEEGIVREVKEETALDVSAPTYLFSLPNRYRYAGMEIPTLDHFFTFSVSEAHAVAHDDASDCEWRPLESISPDEFGLFSISNAVRRYLKEHL